MNNKTRFQEWVIIICLIIWVVLVGIPCIYLWNAASDVKVEGFYITVSIIAVVVNVTLAIIVGKKTWDYYGKISIAESQKKKTSKN